METICGHNSHLMAVLMNVLNKYLLWTSTHTGQIYA